MPGTLEDLLRTLANRGNLALLYALTAGPSYPRQIASRIKGDEREVARRLQVLERANLVQSQWSRQDTKNVKLYSLRTRRFNILLEEDGYRVETPSIASAPLHEFEVERVPARQSLFGREEELRHLTDRRFSFTMVIGLPGVGKTSLAAEFAHRLGAHRVFWHTFTSFDTSRRLLEKAARWLGPRDSPLVRIFDHPAVDLADALDRISRGLSERRAVIVLDDYQQVQEEGVFEVVRRWQRRPEGTRVIVLARVRPPFDVDAKTQVISLGGLPSRASEELLRSRGLAPSERELASVQRMSGGHPLTLVLYSLGPEERDLEHMVVEDLGRRSLEGLDEQARVVLLALAAVRRPLPQEAIRVVAEIEDPSLPLAYLERRALIRSAGRTYKIHDILREALVPIVHSHPELHRRAADMYFRSGRYDDKLEACHHALEIGDTGVVTGFLEADLNEDRDWFVGKQFLGAYRELLDEIPLTKLDPRHQAMVHYARGLVLHFTGTRFAVVREYRLARRLAESAGDRQILSPILMDLGSALVFTGRVFEAERMLFRYLELLNTAGWTSRRAGALYRLHTVFELRGDHKRAKEFCRLAFDEAHRTDNKELLIDIKMFSPEWWPSDWRKVIPALRKQVPRIKAQGHAFTLACLYEQLGEITCRAARGGGSRARVHAEQAIRYLDKAIPGFEAIGVKSDATYARAWRALAFCVVGRIEDAESEAKEVLQRQRTVGPAVSGVLGHLVFARTHQYRRDLVAARTAADSAVRLARRLRSGTLGIALLERALLGDSMGSAQRQDRQLEDAIAATQMMGYPDEVRYARRVARERALRIPSSHGPPKSRGRRRMALTAS